MALVREETENPTATLPELWGLNAAGYREALEENLIQSNRPETEAKVHLST